MLIDLDEIDWALVKAAEAAIEANFDDRKYNHTVGAAVRAANGRVYAGVNCDGIHGSCAEYIAIGAAITAGERDFDLVVAVYGDKAPHAVLPPCGNCRQMLFDYTPGCFVVLQVDGAYKKIPLTELLPYPCK
jgi:cytidine deaminase